MSRTTGDRSPKLLLFFININTLLNFERDGYFTDGVVYVLFKDWFVFAEFHSVIFTLNINICDLCWTSSDFLTEGVVYVVVIDWLVFAESTPHHHHPWHNLCWTSNDFLTEGVVYFLLIDYFVFAESTPSPSLLTLIYINCVVPLKKCKYEHSLTSAEHEHLCVRYDKKKFYRVILTRFSPHQILNVFLFFLILLLLRLSALSSRKANEFSSYEIQDFSNEVIFSLSGTHKDIVWPRGRGREKNLLTQRNLPQQPPTTTWWPKTSRNWREERASVDLWVFPRPSNQPPRISTRFVEQDKHTHTKTSNRP